ncbi:alpha-ketoglutarate-dependent taurine dioxygenase [Coprinopsis cinerea okayama7|uniref:Alpha-ketoglutarate-dependent taurine dioxygenase n=1 Tax=Coprinopsis cinerea (strain Okayama-7 / 130 / ATCC MYA-4618 / FGSC 9003) TaxID=240176 RepID=A8NJQ1_COPC7|nr:alpha-ketoglutarate-dependent taurine dioxygenase [Coprinopsis cinerea okayama7\|eukprot:XP_001834272.1 alpha-ketoglutarate-dependent taurine dioxygenase [Coprinopsis cinerea okayama7\
MAPSVSEISQPAVHPASAAIEQLKAKIKENGSLPNGPAYPGYLPHFDVNEKWGPTELFEHVEPGLRADKAKPNLLTANTKLKHLSPYLGTEVEGVQISQLSKEGLDELALFVAERKVVIFRNQDFKDLGFERQIEIAKHFGPIQRHPTSGNVKGYPEFHVVYRDNSYDYFKEYVTDSRINYTAWHSDVAYEKQPPGTTFFFILDQPSVGGDTLFVSQVEAYNRLSDEFKKRLEGLKIVHSAVEQAEGSRKRNGPVRREPIETEHPIVRVHPATGEKALYVNPVFGRRIVGFKKEESDALLNFLYDHIARGADFQIRASYEPGTVVVWDNRVTAHSAIPDFSPEFRRHAVRLTPQAEVPIPATFA